MKELLLAIFTICMGIMYPANTNAQYSISGQQSTEELYADFIIVEEETPPMVENIKNPYRFKATDIIIPATFIGLGVAGLELKPLKHVNQDVTNALWGNGHKKYKIDDFTEYLPAIANYGLNLCGVKGLHDYIDLTIITGTAYLMMAAIVYPTKDFVYSPRPAGDPRVNSFPSGHTAWAFTGAEIMRREFWHVSPWIGVSGYLVATGTAFMRLYNGAHWLTDVLAGAGIGILCAEAAYWLYPTITKHLFPKRYNSNIFISPTASKNSFGIAASISF